MSWPLHPVSEEAEVGLEDAEEDVERGVECEHRFFWVEHGRLGAVVGQHASFSCSP